MSKSTLPGKEHAAMIGACAEGSCSSHSEKNHKKMSKQQEGSLALYDDMLPMSFGQ